MFKNLLQRLLVAFSLLLVSASVVAQVSVTATGGTLSATYTTLNDAFAAINAGTHTGTIDIAITGNTTEPATPTPLLKSAGTSSYTAISIKPSGGDWVINSAATPTANRGIVELQGADNITFDGDDPLTAGTRNLTIQSVTSGTAIACLRISSNSTTGLDGADNVTVKNMKIVGARASATATNTNYGINFSNWSATSLTGGAYSSLNSVIENNEITRCYRGIYANGASATYINTGLVVRNNVFGSATSAADNIGLSCLFISYTSSTAGATSAIVEGNTFRTGDISISGAGYGASVTGMEVGTVSAGAKIRNNTFVIYQPSTGGWGAYGINVTGLSSDLEIYNNMITAGASKYTTTSINTFVAYGIRYTAGATLQKINHNSIFIPLHQNGTVAGYVSYGLAATVAGVTISEFKNNLIVNENVGTGTNCMYLNTVGNLLTGAANYNNYSAPAGNVGYVGANQTTLAAWQTATSQDANSLNIAAAFKSATNLHIDTTNALNVPIMAGGTPLAAITTDIDGQTRSAATPSIGADEFVIPGCAGQPDAGTLLASVNPVCVAGSSMLSATGITSTDGAGTSYQWLESTDNISWSPIAGAIGLSYNYTNAAATKYFMFVNACANSMLADTAVITVNINAPTYATLPFFENFETSWTNVCATKDVPNNSWRTIPASGNNSWRRQNEGATAGWANPTTSVVVPTTNPTGGTGAANFHTNYSPANVTGALQAYINMSGTSPLELTFDHYNNTGTDTLSVYLSFNGGNTFNLVDRFATTGTVWTKRTVNLGVVNRANGVLKFEVTNLTTFGNDVGIDNILVSPPCVAPPTAGTIVAPSSVCQGTSASLTLSGNTIGPGTSFQWLTSADNVSYTANSTDTLPNLVLFVNDTVWVRTIVGCSGMYDTTAAVQINLNSFLTCYCVVTPSSTTEDDIGQLSIAGFVNPAVRPTPQFSNPAADKTYSNYVDSFPPIDMFKTINYPATVYHFHSTANTSANFCNVYIDYNQNGVFDTWETYPLTKVGGAFNTDFTGLINIPDTAKLGITRMRVSLREGAITGPCAAITWGEVEDYYVNMLPAPACTNPPLPGFITGNSSVCSGGTLAFTLDSSSLGSSYQWQSSVDSITWTDIAGATTTSYTTLAITDTTYYRVKVWCVDTVNSPVKTITLNQFYSCYCASNATNAADTKIDSFNFAGILTGSPATTCETYTSFATPVGSIQKSVASPVKVTNGSCSGNHYTAMAKVFIDLDQSGTYDAGEEMYVSGTSTALGSLALTPGSITIPMSALEGTTGMRVILRETSTASIITACGTYGYGETEDYLINILPAPPCVDTPVAGTISGSPTAIANVSGLYVISTTTGTNYQWQSALDPNGVWSNIAGATNDSLNVTFNVADTVYLRVIVTSTGCMDDTSSSHQVIVTLPGNDVCNAVALTFGVNGPFNTTAATTQVGEPAPPASGCGVQNGWCNNALTNTLWFTFVAPASGRITVQSPDFDTQLALWSADNCDTILKGGATLLAANDDKSATAPTSVSFSSYIDTVKCLIPGKTYYVQLDAYSSPGGSTTVVLTDPGAPNTAFTLDTQYCSSSVAVNLSPVQAGGVFSGTGVSGTTFTPSTAGTYTILYSFGGCDTLSKTTTVVASPVVNLGADTAVCSPNTVVLDAANAGATYMWTDMSTAQTLTASATGTYGVLVTDANGCKGADTIAVTVNALPVVNLGNDTAVCSPNTVVLDAANAGSTYMWTDMSTAQTLTASATGTYGVLVTDANGCKGADTIAVTVNALPVVNLGNDTAVCSPNTVVLDAANAGATYMWTDMSTAQTLTASATGTYGVLVTDANGCKGADTVMVTVNTPPVVNLGADITQCGGTATLDAGNAGAMFMWTDMSTAQTLTATATGTYGVLVTDANGCKGADTVNVTINSVPTVNLGNDTAVCSPNTVTLDAANAGATYMWSDMSTAQTLTVTATGTYSVVVTDANSCTATDAVVVTVNALPVVNLGADITQCGGTATLDAGNAGATYMWTDMSTAQTLTASATGTYGVLVTDANGCKGADTVNVTINTVPTVNLGADTAVCAPNTVTLDAGNAGATYTWSTATTAQTLTVTATGTYSVVVTAPNSCTATDAVVVTVNALPVVNLGADVSQCGGTATLDAGNAGSTYAWSNAATTQTTVVSTSGTYSVVVTTGAGCKGSDTVVVTIKALPTVSFTLSTDTTCVNGGLIALSGTPAGGTFSGTGVSGTNFSPATSGAGTFTITYSVTDATTNCSASASDVIVVKSICAGIENIATIAATIYPTPTTGTINIKGIETNKSSIEAKVYDMQGKVVMINTIAATNANYQMNVSELAAGVYTISITTEKGNYIGRFVRE